MAARSGASGNHVFVSYSHRDATRKDEIARLLLEHGFQVYTDDQLRGAENYVEQLHHAIRTALAFVVLVSPSSVNSTNVLNELNVAMTTHRRLVPVRIEPTQLSPTAALHLGNIQIVDYTDPTSAWQRQDVVDAVRYSGHVPPRPKRLALVGLALVVVGTAVMIGGFVSLVVAGAGYMNDPPDPSRPSIVSKLIPQFLVFMAGMVVSTIGEWLRRVGRVW